MQCWPCTPGSHCDQANITQCIRADGSDDSVIRCVEPLYTVPAFKVRLRQIFTDQISVFPRIAILSKVVTTQSAQGCHAACLRSTSHCATSDGNTSHRAASTSSQYLDARQRLTYTRYYKPCPFIYGTHSFKKKSATLLFTMHVSCHTASVRGMHVL